MYFYCSSSTTSSIISSNKRPVITCQVAESARARTGEEERKEK